MQLTLRAVSNDTGDAPGNHSHFYCQPRDSTLAESESAASRHLTAGTVGWPPVVVLLIHRLA